MAAGDNPVDQMQAVFESVARYFSVLGEPTRLRILHTLCRYEMCVNDIIKVTGLAQANASRHLGLMYQAGMLARRREGTQVFYRVADPMYAELCRTVAAQVAVRSEPPSFPHDGVDRPADAPSSRLGDEPEVPRHPPSNQKEEASV
jgi:DNA-binding transcriptional ArsR family regulator